MLKAYLLNTGDYNKGRIQVVVRRLTLHPTKGWRDQSDHTAFFQFYDDAAAYAAKINRGRA